MHEEERLELISRWIDGDLGPEDERRLLEDIGEQEKYRRLIEEMEALRRAVRRVSLADRPPEMMDLLVEGFCKTRASRWRISLMLPLLAAAALLAVSFLLVREVGQEPVCTHTVDKRSFALKNLPAASGDAPLGPLEELLAEELPEPVIRIPQALPALGPLPEPPPTGNQSINLQIGKQIVPLSGVRASLGDIVELEFDRGIVVSCRTPKNPGARKTLCRALLGREFPNIPSGNFEAKVISRTRAEAPDIE
jgi:hypothetical protein